MLKHKEHAINNAPFNELFWTWTSFPVFIQPHTYTDIETHSAEKRVEVKGWENEEEICVWNSNINFLLLQHIRDTEMKLFVIRKFCTLNETRRNVRDRIKVM
jgi:hypothetical protein